MKASILGMLLVATQARFFRDPASLPVQKGKL